VDQHFGGLFMKIAFGLLISFLIASTANALILREKEGNVSCEATMQNSGSQQYAYFTISIANKVVATESFGYGSTQTDVNALQAYCNATLRAARDYTDPGSTLTNYVIINTMGKMADGTLLTNEAIPNTCGSKK
jgi:hypothetical protein